MKGSVRGVWECGKRSKGKVKNVRKKVGKVKKTVNRSGE